MQVGKTLRLCVCVCGPGDGSAELVYLLQFHVPSCARCKDAVDYRK